MNQRSTQARCPSEHIVTNTCQQRRLFIVPCFMRSYRKPNKKIVHTPCHVPKENDGNHETTYDRCSNTQESIKFSKVDNKPTN